MRTKRLLNILYETMEEMEGLDSGKGKELAERIAAEVFRAQLRGCETLKVQ
jgi:hypothetical protein